MTYRARAQSLVLFVGDLAALIVALWVAIAIRALSIPSLSLLATHLAPFSIVFVLWLGIFFIFDLYGNHTMFARTRMPSTILRAHAINSVLAIAFFYFIPYFAIQPKTILFITLITSFGIIIVWRRYLVEYLPRGRRERVAVLGSTEETATLRREFAANSRYNFIVVDAQNPSELPSEPVNYLILDLSDPAVTPMLASLYPLLYRGVRFLNIVDVYEDVFGREPLSHVNEEWFLKNISSHSKPVYDTLKRILDISISLVLGVCALALSLIVIPFIFLLDGLPITITQERVGERGKVFGIRKFRSMREGQVTGIGRFLRRTRLDELPQLVNVLRGELSLVGPRPEMPQYANIYREQIPFYDIRHIIAPGLSGWAQIYHEQHPHFAPELESTEDKLSYDLYYIKNRSFWLDIVIVLKTIGTLLRVSGK